MKKPRDLTDINSNTGLIGMGPIPGLAPVASFNIAAIENLLNTKGIKGLHYKSAPNPNRETLQGGVDPNDRAALWGFRYYEVHQIMTVPQQFSLENRLNVQGVWGLSTVLLNVKGHYIDGCQELMFASPHDLVVLTETVEGVGVTTEVKQLAEFNPTGPIQLQYRIETIGYLADKTRRYLEDQDFAIKDGKICWLPGGKRPEMSGGNPAILSVVYYAKPIYIVQNVPHAIRILPSNSVGSGALPRKAGYAPQLMIAKQSWIRDDNQQLLDFNDLPEYPTYASSGNVTGGSF